MPHAAASHDRDPVPEPDVDWFVDPLEEETEQLSCLPHDTELPCARCDRAMQCRKEESAA